MEQKIYPIDEFRARKKVSCYCAARRAGQEYFAYQVDELRRAVQKPFILLLDSLEYGVPSCRHGWDLIYSPDLLTGLPSVAARQVLKLAISRLKTGGRLLFANVSFNQQAQACSGCGWSSRNYRSELDLADLTLDIPDNSIGGQAVFRDDSGLLVCLELYKAAA